MTEVAAHVPTNDQKIVPGNKDIQQQHVSAPTNAAQNENEPTTTVTGLKSHAPTVTEGDHDSGVDETTQGQEPTTNGDVESPQKSPSKIPGPKKQAVTSPTKGALKSPVKSSAASGKSPSAKPGDAAAAAVAASAEKKKVPMNKVQVGAAPSPNLKTVRSKIGSLDNASYKPGGGKIKIEHRKLDFSKTQPKIAAKNDGYAPSGGDKKIQQVKLTWNAKPKVGSLDNATHKPGGGDKKIESVKLDFKDKAKPKVGSKDNVKHTPGGGAIKSSSEDGDSRDVSTT